MSFDETLRLTAEARLRVFRSFHKKKARQTLVPFFVHGGDLVVEEKGHTN